MHIINEYKCTTDPVPFKYTTEKCMRLSLQLADPNKCCTYNYQGGDLVKDLKIECDKPGPIKMLANSIDMTQAFGINNDTVLSFEGVIIPVYGLFTEWSLENEHHKDCIFTVSGLCYPERIGSTGYMMNMVGDTKCSVLYRDQCVCLLGEIPKTKSPITSCTQNKPKRAKTSV